MFQKVNPCFENKRKKEKEIKKSYLKLTFKMNLDDWNSRFPNLYNTYKVCDLHLNRFPNLYNSHKLFIKR